MNYSVSRPQLIPQYLPQPFIQLREHQLKGEKDIEQAIAQGHRRVLVSAPTGSGKTLLKAAIARRSYNQGMKTTILVPMNCVVSKSSRDRTQMLGALDAMGLRGKYGVYSGAFPELCDPYAPIQILTLQTLQSKGEDLRTWLSDSDVILIDEGHTASFFKEVEVIYESWQWKIILNFTATPFNRGQGIDDRYGELERNTAIVRLPHYRQLQAMGYLAPLTYHSLVRPVEEDEKLDLESPEAIAWMIDQWLEQTPDPRFAVGFCKPKNKGKAQIELIQSIAADRGIPFTIVGDGVSQQDYEMAIAEYEAGYTNLLCVQALSTGWDVPITQHILLFRRVESRDRYVQIVGRASRPFPSKPCGHVWDFAGNVKLGDSGLHPKIEDLSASVNESVLQPKYKEDGVAPMKNCIQCRKKILAMLPACPYCKAIQPARSLVIIHPSTGKIISSISELEAKQSREAAIVYFRQWRKIGYLNHWKPFAAMVKCHELGVQVDLSDRDFWLGSIFELPQDKGLRLQYQQQLKQCAHRWGPDWNQEKIEKELAREFG